MKQEEADNLNNDLKNANDNIKLLMKFKKWTQATLCKKTGITPVTMRRRLSSKISTWSMMEAVSISKAFNLPVSDIFFTCMVPKCNNTKQVC